MYKSQTDVDLDQKPFSLQIIMTPELSDFSKGGPFLQVRAGHKYIEKRIIAYL
jgi:hypothetical protein